MESASVWRRLSSSTDGGDIVRHLGQQRVAILEGEAAFQHLAVERDLDVDLIVRAVDAGRIVDEVGVDAPAMRGEGHAAGLRDGQVRALADHLGLHLVAVDAVRVVGGIADAAFRTRTFT